MDKLLGKVGSATGGHNSTHSGASGVNNQGAPKEDFADKGLDFVENKMGMKMSRNQNEGITDSARTGFEKLTGKNVPNKISN